MIIKFAGNYHGHVDSLLVAAGSAAATLGVPDSPGVTPGAGQDTLVLAYNDCEGVQQRVRRACRCKSPPSSSSRSSATWAVCRRTDGIPASAARRDDRKMARC